VEPLDSPIRDYAWGSRSVLAELQGRPAPSPGPEAELWIGAHPGSPSTVLREAGPVDLSRLIASAPDEWLGADVTARYGARLPFLLKVLAAEAPLSLQAHPDAERAARRFAAGDPNYVDAYHKPELLVAIAPFEALCGFRQPGRSAAVLDAVGLGEVAAHLRRGSAGLAEAVRLLLDTPGDAAVARAVSADLPPGLADDQNLVRRLAETYPMDPGVLVALLLNHVLLEPGEAVWMPAGNLHAYLRGAGVEVMAASDNVLRGGLTRKRVDVPELLRVLHFEVLEDPVVKPVIVAPGVVTWPVPVDEFVLHRACLAGETVNLPLPGPRMVLCTAGEVSCADDGEPVVLTPGRAAVGAAGRGPVVLTGHGEAFVACVGG
jgi:mannose-6-phosphate isomerase